MSDVNEKNWEQEDWDLSRTHQAAILISSLILAIIITVSNGGGIGAFIFFFIGSLGLIGLVSTKRGRMALIQAVLEIQEEMDNQNMQQQQVGGQSSSQPTQICSECGWKNPKKNNYCHDCGSELDG